MFGSAGSTDKLFALLDQLASMQHAAETAAPAATAVDKAEKLARKLAAVRRAAVSTNRVAVDC